MSHGLPLITTLASAFGVALLLGLLADRLRLPALAFRYPLNTALRVSASLAQIGEFSFILARLGASVSACCRRKARA